MSRRMGGDQAPRLKRLEELIQLLSSSGTNPLPPYVDPTLFGYKPDGQLVDHGSVGIGDNNVTISGGIFSPTSVGRLISVGGRNLGTITNVLSPTHVQTSLTSPANVINETTIWGTDNTSALQATIDFAFAQGVSQVESDVDFIQGGATILMPSGMGCLSGTLAFPNRVNLIGQGPGSNLAYFGARTVFQVQPPSIPVSEAASPMCTRIGDIQIMSAVGDSQSAMEILDGSYGFHVERVSFIGGPFNTLPGFNAGGIVLLATEINIVAFTADECFWSNIEGSAVLPVGVAIASGAGSVLQSGCRSGNANNCGRWALESRSGFAIASTVNQHVTTEANHGLSTGDVVFNVDVPSTNETANGQHVITVTGLNTFDLQGYTGAGSSGAAGTSIIFTDISAPSGNSFSWIGPADVEGNGLGGITGSYYASEFSRLYFEGADPSVFIQLLGSSQAITVRDNVVNSWGLSQPYAFKMNNVNSLTITGNRTTAPLGGSQIAVCGLTACSHLQLSANLTFSASGGSPNGAVFCEILTVPDTGLNNNYVPSNNLALDVQTYRFAQAAVTAPSQDFNPVPADSAVLAADYRFDRPGYVRRMSTFLTGLPTAGNWQVIIWATPVGGTVAHLIDNAGAIQVQMTKECAGLKSGSYVQFAGNATLGTGKYQVVVIDRQNFILIGSAFTVDTPGGTMAAGLLDTTIAQGAVQEMTAPGFGGGSQDQDLQRSSQLATGTVMFAELITDGAFSAPGGTNAIINVEVGYGTIGG